MDLTPCEGSIISFQSSERLPDTSPRSRPQTNTLPAHSAASAANTLQQESEIDRFLMATGCRDQACLYPHIPIARSTLAWLLTLRSAGGPTRRCLSKETPEPHPSGLLGGRAHGHRGPSSPVSLSPAWVRCRGLHASYCPLWLTLRMPFAILHSGSQCAARGSCTEL